MIRNFNHIDAAVTESLGCAARAQDLDAVSGERCTKLCNPSCQTRSPARNELA